MGIKMEYYPHLYIFYTNIWHLLRSLYSQLHHFDIAYITKILIPYLNFSEGYPPLVFPTMQLMVEALNLHVISVAWDLQYLTCLAESSRTKIKPMNVTDMNSGTMVTKPGKLFYDTLLVSSH